MLLAGLEPADVRDRLAVALESFTVEHGGRSSPIWSANWQTVRERGWASVAEELEVGLNAVAAPVYDSVRKSLPH